jgi:Domain of unknown function (DUF4198)
MNLPQRHGDTETRRRRGRQGDKGKRRKTPCTTVSLPSGLLVPPSPCPLVSPALWLCGSVASLIFLIASAAAHDLFLKFDSFFLKPNAKTTVRLLNGYFNRSENAVARDRMRDVSVVTPSGDRVNPPASDWRDENGSALLSLQTSGEGTYVAGVSTNPREITLKAAQFNDYLRHDGVPDTLAQRRRDKELAKSARERYSKHVKAIFQVGESKTGGFKTALGYPVEIIPQQNPYDLKIGNTIEVLCLKDGKPVADQFVMVGRESNRRVIATPSVRADANGVARVKLTGGGKWFVKFIHMTKLNEANLDYESKWASLTFEIRR